MTVDIKDSHADDDTARRLRAEAEAQNARVHHAGPEARDKYYFLLEKAFRTYERALGPVDGKRILVAGCSEGGVLALARNGGRVTGIDVADEAIRSLTAKIAKERLSARADAFVMNAETVDYPAGTFDLIVCTGVLHHLIVEKAASSWARVLKPGGRVIMMEPMARNPAAALYRLATPSMHTVDEHPLKPADIRVLKQHFGRVSLEGFAFTSTLAVIWALLPDPLSMKLRWRNGLDKFDRALMKWFPSLTYCAWSAVIECTQPLPRDAAPQRQ